MYNVYKIVNSINNKVYVGRTTHTLKYRWEKGHLKCLERGDQRHLYQAMRKYGVDKFHIELIEECCSFDDMVYKEAYYCEKYRAYTDGYNMTTGGEINPMECVKAKFSHDTKMRSLSVRSKISQTMKKVRAESDKNILIHKGEKGKRVNIQSLDSYLQDGYELGSNARGKIRIYNKNSDKESSVWKHELNKYLELGWVIGSKPNRISSKQRQALDASHYKKVYAISDDGKRSPIFLNLKDACNWWYQEILAIGKYSLPSYIQKRNYGLADYIKKTSVKNVYIYGYKWIYPDEGGDNFETVS